eukprot:13465076-Alexandrium_andersonii.AAC.1
MAHDTRDGRLPRLLLATPPARQRERATNTIARHSIASHRCIVDVVASSECPSMPWAVAALSPRWKCCAK